MEIWKNVIGFEGLYEVSNLGNIKSLGKGKSTNSLTKLERIIILRVKNNGYLQAKLSKDGIRSHLLAHRLVAKAFIPNPNNLPEVNHIDSDKQNNKLENLEWISSSGNQKYAFIHGQQKVVRGANHKQSIPVVQLSLNGDIIKEWASIKEIKREIGFNTFGIIKCCKKENKYKTAYGFKWMYKDEFSKNNSNQ